MLPNFKGTAIHDFWNTYFGYDCNHGLCNVHHLRDLEGIEEFYGQKWPGEMADLLLKIKEIVDIKRPVAGKLEQEEIGSFKQRYNSIIESDLDQNPIAKVGGGPKKRGYISTVRTEVK